MDASKRRKANKYGAKKTTVDGIVFDSKREALRYCELRILEKAGQISGLCRQVSYELAPSTVIQGRKRPPLRYVADFTYNLRVGDCWVPIVEDAKGHRTEGFRIKRHLMKTVQCIDITEV